MKAKSSRTVVGSDEFERRSLLKESSKNTKLCQETRAIFMQPDRSLATCKLTVEVSKSVVHKMSLPQSVPIQSACEATKSGPIF